MTLQDTIRAESTLPRSNGELVFQEPWHARAFGITVALVDAGACDWNDFRDRLIAEIGHWTADTEGDADAAWDYYAHWARALERLLAESDLVTAQELRQAQDVARHRAEHEHDEGHHHEH